MSGILSSMKFQQPPGMSSLLKKEIDAEISRAVGTLLAGEGGPRLVKLGQPLGMITGTEAAPAGPKKGKLVAWDPSATDGSQVIHGICLKDIEAAEDVDRVNGVLYSRRLAVINPAAIIWPAGINDEQKETAAADIEQRLGLILRA